MAEKLEAKFASIDELFGADLDDIQDLASFETPPTGAYILNVTTDQKEINDKDAVEAAFEVVETVELKYPDPTHPKYVAPVLAGTKFSTAFILGSGAAEGFMKRFLLPFAGHFNTKKVGELVRDHIKNVQITAMVTRVPDKDDPERFYARVSNIEIV